MLLSGPVWGCTSSSVDTTFVAGAYAFGDAVSQVRLVFDNCAGFSSIALELTCGYAALTVDALALTGADGRLENIDCELSFR